MLHDQWKKIYQNENQNLQVDSIENYGDNLSSVKAFVYQDDAKEKLMVIFKFQKMNKEWMIYDLVVDNENMIEKYKLEYRKIIKEQGFEKLLKTLEAKARKLK